LKQPTLYSCLKRLEVQGFVRSYWGAKTVGGIGGRRKYYTLTDMGREIFLKNQTDWEYSRTVIDRLISDKSYDLGNVKSFDNEELNDENDNNSDVDLENEFNDENDGFGETNATMIEEETSHTQEPQEENLIMDMSMVISDVAQSIQAEPAPAPSSQNENSTTININNYIDPSNLIKDLFNKEENQSSYFEHAKSQDYEEPTETESDEPKITTREYIEQLIEEKFTAERAAGRPIEEIVAPSNEGKELAVTDEPAPQDANLSFGQTFISYNQRNATPLQTDKMIIEREYKDALALLLKNNEASVDIENIDAPPSPHTIVLPQTQDQTRMHTRDALVQMRDTGIKVQTTQLATTRYYDNSLEGNLTKIVETAKNSGDNIKTRIHDGEVALLYEAKYYYYSNKLMIRQSLVSFLIATASVFLAFLIVHFGAGTAAIHPFMPNWSVYLIGFLVPLVFPIVAAVKYLLNPEKLRRVDYSLRSSMAFRAWVVVLLLIITYCGNLLMGMYASFYNGTEYLATLLIPIFLILNLPISGLLFFGFYSSKKFHQYQ